VTAGPFADATAYGMLASVAARDGERDAIVFDGERITFRTLLARVDAFAAGLAALGLGKGDALGIWLPNRPLWYVAQYAAARQGIVVVALNPRYRAHELNYILGQSRATALLITDHLGAIDYLDMLAEVIPELASAVPGELASATLPHLRQRLCQSRCASQPSFSRLRGCGNACVARWQPGPPAPGRSPSSTAWSIPGRR